MTDIQEATAAGLLNKLALSSAPNLKSTRKYISAANSSSEIISAQQVYGKYSQSLQSTAWGSSSTITVPSSSMVSNCYLYYQMTVPAPPGVSYSPLWETGVGYSMLAQVAYTLGSANTSQLALQGREAIIMCVMNSCGTAEGATEYWYQAGNNSAAIAAGNNRSTTNSYVIEGTLLLPLPWSSTCPEGRVPFDLSLLQSGQPVLLRIDLVQNPGSFMGGFNAATWNPPVLTTATILFTHNELSDSTFSLGSQLRLASLKGNNQMIVSYPFIHYQAFTAGQQITAPTNGTSYGGLNSQVQSIPLNSFIRSDLLGISFALINTVDDIGGVTAALPGGGTAIGRFNPQTIPNFELLYNGQRLMYCPGTTSCQTLMNMKGSQGSTYFEGSNQSGTVSASYNVSPAYLYPITYWSSQLGRKSVCDPFWLDNTVRYSNQTLTLNFTCPLTTVPATYRLVCLYSYQALIEVGAQGQTSIIFN